MQLHFSSGQWWAWVDLNRFSKNQRLTFLFILTQQWPGPRGLQLRIIGKSSQSKQWPVLLAHPQFLFSLSSKPEQSTQQFTISGKSPTNFSRPINPTNPKSMAINTPSSPLHLCFFLLLITTLPPSTSVSFSQFKTLTSLSHSLMTRVANLRASRGDISGSNRARSIADKLERGLGLVSWGVIWSMGWDYVKNYAWRDMASAEMFGAVSDMNELLRSLNELTRIESDIEKAAWVKRNYQKVFGISNSLFRSFLQVFSRSGAMREVVETVQREVVDGGLLRDCLEIGSNDLKGLLQVLKDIALQFTSSTSYEDVHDL